MSKHGLEGVPLVLWHASIFTSCLVFASKRLQQFFSIYTFLLIIAMQDETRGKRSTWQNLEGVSVVWWFMLIVTLVPLFGHHFLVNLSCDFWDYSSKEGSLEHGKTWLGRRFCCLVIHACPICASKWLWWCYFSPFLWMLDFKLGKST